MPFILRAPGQKPRKESALVSGADVAPTLAAAAGAPLPQPLDGVSRLDAACESNAAVVIEASDWVAMKDADATLVLALNGTESSLGAAKPPAAWKPQLQKYMDILRNLHAPATNTPAADAELRGKLKAAGYLK